ncbi:MAG: hypothetical protein ACP6IP_06405 [Candidatus Njordarchaeia archaeon]
MYYNKIRSLNILLGDDGILRLPAYLPQVYVIDEARKNAIETAVKLLQQGKNVLIEGSPGTGKTALMFMVLREITQFAQIGYIVEGATAIQNAHLEEGVVLFYDDIPRMNRNALKSIFKNNVKGIIATARSEEVALIQRLLGENIYDHFEAIKIPPLSREKIREMLNKYIESEALKIVDEEAAEIVVEKAQGLPVYVWQVVRELKIRKQNLTKEFAKTIPRGMLDYVDSILWRLLGGKEERFEALVTLLTMTDFAKYSVNQDLYTYIYMIAKEQRIKQTLTIENIVMDAVFADFSRYLAREGATYSYRLPHDSWADVLKGKSNGPMAPEISNINILYKDQKRKNLAVEAARRAWHETVKEINDEFRKDAFLKNIEINLGEAAKKDIIENPPTTTKCETTKIPSLFETIPRSRIGDSSKAKITNAIKEKGEIELSDETQKLKKSKKQIDKVKKDYKQTVKYKSKKIIRRKILEKIDEIIKKLEKF